ncbi:MAG: septum formation initiator family protein [Thermoanaerobaculum sp.]|nr:septum formation initiator family protein [Thermoanaerobaculum sp.]
MALRPIRFLRLVGLAVLLAYWAWNWLAGQRELRAARQEWQALAGQKAALLEQVRQLRKEVESLQRDPEAQGRAARQFLGVCGTREKVVILPRQ